MKKIIKTVLINSIITGSFLEAEGWMDTLVEYGNKTVEITKEYGGKTLEVSKKYGSKAIEQTKVIAHDMVTDDISFKAFYKEGSEVDWVGLGVDIGLDIITFDGVSLLKDISENIAFNLVSDATLDYAMNTYSYQSLAEESKEMITLSLPVNKNGSDLFEQAIIVLNEVNKEISLSNESNQIVIKKAIEILQNNYTTETDKDKLSKDESFLAILYFITNNYTLSKEHAYKSITLAKEVDTIYTLPAFIYANASLYDKDINFDKLTKDYFRYSIIKEQDNPLIPLLFTIFIDRTILRINNNTLHVNELKKIFNIATLEVEHKPKTYTIILSRFIMLLELTKQKIESLTSSSNETIKNSPRTLLVVKEAMKNYNILLNESANIFNAFPDLENKALIQQYNANKLQLKSLRENEEKLQKAIHTLERYQK